MIKKNIRPKDEVAESKHEGSVWRNVALFLGCVAMISVSSTAYLGNKLSNVGDRTQFILAPGIQTLTIVRPGELPKSYVELAYKRVASLANGWNYSNVEDNYKTLFDLFYSKELTERTKANLESQNYFKKAEENQFHSMWRYLPRESQFNWCGEVKILNHHQGVACGIVTGEQTLYAGNNVPVLKRKLSYLMFALNVAPNPNTPGRNLFGIQFFRVKRGERSVLEKELKDALTKGVLPPEGEDNGIH